MLFNSSIALESGFPFNVGRIKNSQRFRWANRIVLTNASAHHLRHWFVSTAILYRSKVKLCAISFITFRVCWRISTKTWNCFARRISTTYIMCIGNGQLIRFSVNCNFRLCECASFSCMPFPTIDGSRTGANFLLNRKPIQNEHTSRLFCVYLFAFHVFVYDPFVCGRAHASSLLL